MDCVGTCKDLRSGPRVIFDYRRAGICHRFNGGRSIDRGDCRLCLAFEYPPRYNVSWVTARTFGGAYK